MSVPVEVYTGTELDELHRRLQECPVEQRWRLLVEGWLVPPEWQRFEALAYSGCACCTGQIALRTLLMRALRRGGVDRIVLLLSRGDHAGNTIAMLTEAQYSGWLVVERVPTQLQDRHKDEN